MPSSEFDQHDVPSTPNDSNSRKMTIRSTKIQRTERINSEGVLAGRELCAEIEDITLVAFRVVNEVTHMLHKLCFHAPNLSVMVVAYYFHVIC